MSRLTAIALFALLGSLPLRAENTGPNVDWPNIGNDKGGSRNSALTQINRQNVGKLKVAWTYRTGELDPQNLTTIECTPIIVGGVMYITTIYSKVVALDAATGKVIWTYDPFAVGAKLSGNRVSGGVNRGVAYWSDGKPNGEKRVLLASSDGRLISLHAATGKPDPAFGKSGILDMREGLDRDLSKLAYGCTAPPAIFENLAVVGYSVGEGPGPTAPGDIRAFDVRTGREVWRFHTVPRPGEVGHDTWEGDSWKDRGAANAWNGYTVDVKNGILFAGLGSAAFDFYGGDRKGDNLFANCVLALDARSGRYLWHYQVVRHDIWDYDNPCPPVLCNLKKDGKSIEAVAQVTKTGHVFVFERKTGKPVFPIEERVVPASDVPGEQSATRQPFPLMPPPFAKHGFREDDVTDISPESRANILKQIKGMRLGPIYTPPTLEQTVLMPGYHGGANWSGAAFDAETGNLYVNSNNIPRLAGLEKAPEGAGYAYKFRGYNFLLDQEGYPGVKPPWGMLNAINLNRGDFSWRTIFGEFPELKKRGIPQTGTESFGGAIVTRGGLVFIGGTMDEKFRAYDKLTGKVLWEFQLDAGGYASPATYMVKGRQYVVIAAGGGGKLRTRAGDTFYAFALPEGK